MDTELGQQTEGAGATGRSCESDKERRGSKTASGQVMGKRSLIFSWGGRSVVEASDRSIDPFGNVMDFSPHDTEHHPS